MTTRHVLDIKHVQCVCVCVCVCTCVCVCVCICGAHKYLDACPCHRNRILLLLLCPTPSSQPCSPFLLPISPLSRSLSVCLPFPPLCTLPLCRVTTD